MANSLPHSVYYREEKAIVTQLMPNPEQASPSRQAYVPLVTNGGYVFIFRKEDGAYEIEQLGERKITVSTLHDLDARIKRIHNEGLHPEDEAAEELGEALREARAFGGRL